MRPLLGACIFVLAACAAPETARTRTVALLSQDPQRPYEQIARIEARSAPGSNVRHAYDELREKAHRLGADAVIKLEQRELTDAAPAPYAPAQRPLLGNAYPGPLGVFEPGAFPPEGADLRVRGRYYLVAGVAIRYLD